MIFFYDFIGIPFLILRWGWLKTLLFTLIVSPARFTLVWRQMRNFGTPGTVRISTAAQRLASQHLRMGIEMIWWDKVVIRMHGHHHLVRVVWLARWNVESQVMRHRMTSRVGHPPVHCGVGPPWNVWVRHQGSFIHSRVGSWHISMLDKSCFIHSLSNGSTMPVHLPTRVIWV